MHPPALNIHDRSSSGEGTSKESRTPVAWRTREQNLIHQPILQEALVLSSPLPNSTSTSSSANSDETSSEVETSDSSRKRYNRLVPLDYTTNTLRSSRSVPALNDVPTWSGEPCPVHGSYNPHSAVNPVVGPPLPPPPAIIINGHNPYGTCHFPPQRIYPANYAAMRKAGSLFDMRLSNYPVNPSPRLHLLPRPPSIALSHLSLAPTPIMAPPLMDKKSIYGSESSLHAVLPALTPIPPAYSLPPMPPPHLLPPGMRPRPLVIPAGAEPLPVRKSKSGLPDNYQLNGSIDRNLDRKYAVQFDGKTKQKYHCCKGPLPLIWFIIGIVTMGVVLGVVLGSIYS